MKRLILTLVYFLLAACIFAQEYTIDFNASSPNQSKSSTANQGVVYNFSYPGINFIEVATPEGIYNEMFVPNTYRSGREGEPQLLSSHKLISIPLGYEIKAKVLSFTTNDYIIGDYFVDNKIIPFQPSYSKNENSSDKELLINKSAYQKDYYRENEIVSVKVLGNLRDTRIAKLIINPVAYNPTQNSLRFYNDIQVAITLEKSTIKETTDSRKTYSPYFKSTIEKIEPILSPGIFDDHPDLQQSPVKYLIVTPNTYLNTLQSFIEWKTQKGFEVVVGDMNVIGSTAAEIKTWIQNQYNIATAESPAPSFLLLVGDVEQIPASQMGNNTNKVTDLYYASVDGDMFPDMYYGRISAQNTEQLEAMLAKTLMYEKYQFPDDSFLNDITLIAGADGTWNPRVGQPTLNYGTENYFNAAHGFTNVNSYLTSYTDCYTDEKVGVSMINYTAHCSQTSWDIPNLGISAVTNFGNEGKYPVAIGNCCTSADFNVGECIGEAWVRNPNGGAIAYLGSVPDTFWWEDFYWAVGAHAPVSNEYPSADSSSLGVYDAPFLSDYHTVDAMIFVGNLAVTEAHNEGYNSDINSQYYWEAYHCLGDPSVVPYLTTGQDNYVTHDQMFKFGILQFEVKAAPGSMVALSNSNGLIGTVITDADSVGIIATDTLTVIDSVSLVITKPQFKPYIVKLPVGSVEGTYLILENIVIDDESGNSNQEIEYGENFNLNVSLKNIGNKTAKNVWLTITCDDIYVESISNNIKIAMDSISADTIQSIVNKFNVKVKDSIPDQHTLTFDVLFSDSISGAERVFYNEKHSRIINAPHLNILASQFIDDFLGNGNYGIDYGEIANLQLGICNNGHAQVSSTVILSNISVNKALQINSNELALGNIGIDDTVYFNFEIHLPEDAALKKMDTLLLEVDGGAYLATSELSILLGTNLFSQIGTENLISIQYPFYNYWKNNSTQILYLASELGAGVKAIKSVAFNIAQFTNNGIYRDLSDFTIRAAFTDEIELSGAQVLNNPKVLYLNNQYVLPSVLGWEKFEFQQPIIIGEGNNVILEISWGPNDNYSSEDTSTRVYSSNTDFKSVVWGASDDINPAPLVNTSYSRPNTQFEFDSVGILNISVTGNVALNKSNEIENCEVSIGSESKLTDNLGRTQFYFIDFTGNYTLNFSTYGYADTAVSINKTQTYEHLGVEMLRNPELKIQVNSTLNMPIENVQVTIDGRVFTTNSFGEIVSYSNPLNNYTVYSITCEGYMPLVDSVLLESAENSAVVTLEEKHANIEFLVSNTKNEPISNAELILNFTSKNTNDKGRVTFENIEDGEYGIQFYHRDYKYQIDTITVENYDSLYSNTLKTVGNVIINISDGISAMDSIEVSLGENIKSTNNQGFVEFFNQIEGKYALKIENEEYYSYYDSIAIFGKENRVDVNLTPKADIKLYIHNGLTGISNARVYFDTLIVNADSSGVVSINNYNEGLVHYSVDVDGYYSVADSIQVAFDDTVLNIRMDFIPDLEFNLTGPNLEFNKIPLLLNEDTLYFSNEGKVKLTNIGMGIFSYQIREIGYREIIDSVIITNRDTLVELYLKPLPDIKFVLSENGRVVDSALVYINELWQWSNNFGEAYFFDLEKETYQYAIEKQGYVSSQGSIGLSENDTLINIQMHQKPDVLFTVLHNGVPIENALVKIDTFNLITNGEGKCIAKDLLPGSIEYSVTNSEFLPYSDSLILTDKNVHEIIELSAFEFNVTFTVTNGAEFVENAQVTFNGLHQYTDENGATIFAKVAVESNLSYLVVKDGFNDYSGALSIVDEDVFLKVEMTLKTYDVQFFVMDIDGSVESANISFDSKVKATNKEGQADFYEVLPGKDIPYFVVKNETHFSESGSVSLNTDTTINVILLTIAINDELYSFKMYPNPSKGHVYIETDYSLSEIEYTIINNVGTIVCRGKIVDVIQKIELTGQANGLYHLNLYLPDNKLRSHTIILGQ